MNRMTASADAADPFDLARFTRAQTGVFDSAVSELRRGEKRGHWMWFVFPQIMGLGSSATAVRFAIKSRAEAEQYLEHPVLGARLRKCAELLLTIEDRTTSEIFGYPDDLKLKSSMTLFASVAETDSVFVRVLEKYFHGEGDPRTLQLLETPTED
jgi:uncharacterized protein (DUF1810 family)